MITQALAFLVDTLLGLYAGVLLLRFLLQTTRTSARNPIGQAVIALTDPVVRPARRVVPGWAGLDLSTLLLAWLAEWLLLCLLQALGGGVVSPLELSLPVLAALAAVRLLRTAAQLLMAAAVVQAVLSWVAPHNPLAPTLAQLLRPFLRPLQQRLPMVGPLDLSPLVLLLLLQLFLMLPVAWLAGQVIALGLPG